MRVLAIITFVCLAAAHAQNLQGNANTATFKTEKVGPDTVLATGHESSYFEFGIQDVEEQYHEEFKECQRDLKYHTFWQKDFIPVSHPYIKSLLSRPHIQHLMNLALEADLALKAKLGNYSEYVKFDLGYRGPSHDMDPNFKDCLDVCPTGYDVVGALNHKTFGPCLVINPFQQMLQYRECRTLEAQQLIETPDERLSYSFRNRFVCVPDSFVEKNFIAFCMNLKVRQCQEFTIRLPLSCSPKIAKCKYTEAGMRLRNQQKLAAQQKGGRLSYMDRMRKKF